MKIRKMVAGLILVLGIMVIGATNASAAEGNYTCTIIRVGGQTEGAQYVTLRDTAGSFSNLACRIPESRLNQTLAVLLTAASNGATVYVRVDPVLPAPQRFLKIVYYDVE